MSTNSFRRGSLRTAIVTGISLQWSTDLSDRSCWRGMDSLFGVFRNFNFFNFFCVKNFKILRPCRRLGYLDGIGVMPQHNRFMDRSNNIWLFFTGFLKPLIDFWTQIVSCIVLILIRRWMKCHCGDVFIHLISTCTSLHVIQIHIFCWRISNLVVKRNSVFGCLMSLTSLLGYRERAGIPCIIFLKMNWFHDDAGELRTFNRVMRWRDSATRIETIQ